MERARKKKHCYLAGSDWDPEGCSIWTGVVGKNVLCLGNGDMQLGGTMWKNGTWL
jgi:hypothetical protein